MLTQGFGQQSITHYNQWQKILRNMLFINRGHAYLPCTLKDLYSKQALDLKTRFPKAENFQMPQILGVRVQIPSKALAYRKCQTHTC